MNYIDQLKIKGILYTLKDPTVADLINARIQELIGTAPANLDTLQELAAAISSGDEAVESILTTLATKTSKEYVDNLFANIQLTPGPQGETGPLGPKGDTGTFDYSDLADYVTHTALGTKIGNLGTTVPVYSFESYSSNGAVKYGEGTIKPTGETGTDVAEVIVVTNTSTDPNAAEFAGQKFWIAENATIGDTLYQLLDAEGQEVGIAVKITAIDVRDLTVKEYVDALDLKKANVGDSYTKQESDAKYLTTHQDISGKADKSQLTPLEAAAQKVSHMPEFGDFTENEPGSFVEVFSDTVDFVRNGPNSHRSSAIGESIDSFKNKQVRITINGVSTITDSFEVGTDFPKYEYQEFNYGNFYGVKIGSYYTLLDSETIYYPVIVCTDGQLGLTGSTNNDVYKDVVVKVEIFDATVGTHPVTTVTKLPKKYLSLPTNVSELANDAGYLTTHQDISGKADLTLIGELGNKSEAVEATYYTAEEAAAYNTENELLEGDEGYKSEGDLKSAAIEAVPYSTVIEVILDKYQSLLARIEALENV